MTSPAARASVAAASALASATMIRSVSASSALIAAISAAAAGLVAASASRTAAAARALAILLSASITNVQQKIFRRHELIGRALGPIRNGLVHVVAVPQGVFA
ncbi:hypothetical protein MSM1_07980 [Mycobacterium sp. SM1]|uniref:hypothetical protein n=1 Tax=Mycobacterium sp. SM1 TaxID=2816243 RepID=UPI001BCF2C53|nr:hypothetical protein [Mycobacterium sp. SM1]MBS4728283.1 hypothetical protein [Mycobacterium sp. SM1]